MNKISKQIYLYIGIFLITIFFIISNTIVSKADTTSNIEIGDEVSGLSTTTEFQYYRLTVKEDVKLKITVSVGKEKYSSDYFECYINCMLENLENNEVILDFSDTFQGTSDKKTIVLKAGEYEFVVSGNKQALRYNIGLENVSVYTEKVSIPSKAGVWIGGTRRLKASLTPKNSLNKGITWKTSNKKIATVSDDGTVTGISQGTCTISAVLKGRNTTKCTLTVKKKPQLYIKAAGFGMNFLGGVEPYITLENNFGKSIKYIYLNTYYYNGVGDPAYCEIQRTNYQRLKITGEIEKNEMNYYKWNAVIYNTSARRMYIKSAEVIFMDGSRKTVSIKKGYR